MALVLGDRIVETTNTGGTGTVSLNGAVAGYTGFSVIGNANTTYYTISDETNGTWEVGVGTYTASGSTFSRDTVLASSNAGSLVSFAAITKYVFCDYPAPKSVYTDSAGNLIIGSATSLIFANSTNTNYVGFTGGVTTTSVNWVLPIADGTNLQSLATDGAGNLSWATVQTMGNVQGQYRNMYL